jgi:hypothetical protein
VTGERAVTAQRAEIAGVWVTVDNAVRMRIAWGVALAVVAGLGCGSESPLAPGHDAATDRAGDISADTSAEAPGGPGDVAEVVAAAGDAGDVGVANDGATDAVDLGAGDADGGSDTCAGSLTLRLTWSIRTKDGVVTSCAQAGADAVVVTVDAKAHPFSCDVGGAQIPGLVPGTHAVAIELVGGSGLGTTTSSAAPNPTRCVNDIDCVATPACGGEICDWINGMTCQPAGRSPKGQDGWCTTDNDCKCFAQGARCAVPYCTFTQSVAKVLVMGQLPARDYGCGAADLGAFTLQLP